jgi:hypothetical protein
VCRKKEKRKNTHKKEKQKNRKKEKTHKMKKEKKTLTPPMLVHSPDEKGG